MHKFTHKDPDIHREVQRRLAHGGEAVTMRELNQRLRNIGYRLDRRNDCFCSARDMATGESYPCCTGYVVQLDDGVSFANVNARRDSSFEELQKLRRNLIVIRPTHIFEI